MPLRPASLALTERPLYGAARLGALRKSEELYAAPSSTGPDPVQQVDLRYELTDHLGNVSAVLTGRLLPGNGMGSAWQPEVVAAQGYEPFGSLLPGRNYSSDSYRFSFNGQEKDNEVYGSEATSYTAEFWQYDPRIGRRWNLDPKPNPSLSSYAAFALNPIRYSDPLGDNLRLGGDIASAWDDIRSLVPEKYRARIVVMNSNMIIFNANGISDEVFAADAGLMLVHGLTSSPNNYLYEVTDASQGRAMATGQPVFENLETKDSKVSNYSTTPYLPEYHPHKCEVGYEPRDGFDGQVGIHPDAVFYEMGANGDRVEKNRASAVFHELQEVFCLCQ